MTLQNMTFEYETMKLEEKRKFQRDIVALLVARNLAKD